MQQTEAFVGEIRMVGFGFAPIQWAPCEGQLLPVQQYMALFSLLGNQYGGDGQSTFALPDLRGSVPFHQGPGTMHFIIALEGIYPQRHE